MVRLDKKGREKCSYYIGGGSYCEHTATLHEDGKPRCGTHSKTAFERRTARFRARMAAQEAAGKRWDALSAARAEVLKAAREWRAVMKPGMPASMGSMKRVESALEVAVDALVALESEGA